MYSFIPPAGGLGSAGIQTTVLPQRTSLRLRVPDVVLLMVIACAQWLKPEPGVLLGFTGGLLLDLFGTAPLGLHALGFTLAAYATVRVGDRFNYGIYFSVSAVGRDNFHRAGHGRS